MASISIESNANEAQIYADFANWDGMIRVDSLESAEAQRIRVSVFTKMLG